MQEDLTSLFDRSLSLQPPPTHQIQYSISRHYHHSSHQTSTSPSIPTSPETAVALLTSNNIDPSILSPAQQDLFTTLSLPQQLRLIEIWRASPPETPFHTPNATTLNQEEELARARLERKAWTNNRETYGFSSTPNLGALESSKKSGSLEERGASHMDDGSHNDVAAFSNSEGAKGFHDQAEPYIVTGYTNSEAQQGGDIGGYQHLGSAVGRAALVGRAGGSSNWAYEYNRATDPVYSDAPPANQHQASEDMEMV